MFQSVIQEALGQEVAEADDPEAEEEKKYPLVRLVLGKAIFLVLILEAVTTAPASTWTAKAKRLIGIGRAITRKEERIIRS